MKPGDLVQHKYESNVLLLILSERRYKIYGRSISKLKLMFMDGTTFESDTNSVMSLFEVISEAR